MQPQRATSTKTRIKTRLHLSIFQLFLLTQRATSTKTRIKTMVFTKERSFEKGLKEQLPLKQGLRL